MRIVYGMNNPESGEKSPVVAYQERYEATHPVDRSFKGTLSRISGLSMDDVALLIEFIDYSTQIANYDPSTRDKFGDYKEAEVKPGFTQTDAPSINILSIISEPFFIDRRNYIV